MKSNFDFMQLETSRQLIKDKKSFINFFCQLTGKYYIILQSYAGPDFRLDATRTVWNSTFGGLVGTDVYRDLQTETYRTEYLKFKPLSQTGTFSIIKLGNSGYETGIIGAGLYAAGNITIVYTCKNATNNMKSGKRRSNRKISLSNFVHFFIEELALLSRTPIPATGTIIDLLKQTAMANNLIVDFNDVKTVQHSSMDGE